MWFVSGDLGVFYWWVWQSCENMYLVVSEDFFGTGGIEDLFLGLRADDVRKWFGTGIHCLDTR